MAAFRAGALLVATSLFAAPARAADVTVVAGVRVALPTCPIAPVPLPAFVDSLRVELTGHPRAPGTTVVALAIEPCDTATTRVHVGVTNDASAAATESDVGLEDIAAEARPRALALAVAELVRGAQGSPPPAPPPIPAMAPPPAAPEAKVRVAADALVELFPSRDTTLWGGRLSAALARELWSVALFGEAAAGEHRYDAGTVSVQTFGGGLIVGPRWAAGRLRLGPSLVGALGWTRVQGHAAAAGVTAGSGSGLTAALRARFGLSAGLGRGVSARAFVEGGWMLRGFDATVEGARAAGASGPTLLGGLGVGF